MNEESEIRDNDRCVALRRWDHRCAAVAAVLTALTIWPIVTSGLGALDLRWLPSGDWAVLSLRVDDVGRITPLVGPYSRFGWNHPGPLMFWLLAIPYRLFGSRAEALLVGTAVLNATCVAALGALAWRRGRLPLVALTMGAMAIVIHTMGPALLRDPWNPFITVFPLAVIVYFAWSILEGDVWLWPPALFVASFILQSHIGYLPMLVVLALGVLAITLKRSSTRSLLPRTPPQRAWLLALSAIVLVSCWLPVIVDQLTQTGNLGAMLEYFRSPVDQPAGFGTALSTAADQLRLPQAPWLGRSESTGSDGALLGSNALHLIFPLGAMVLSAWIGIRSRVGSALRFQTLVTSVVLGGVIATSRVNGPLFNWIVRWWWILGALWWIAVLWTLWSSVTGQIRSEAINRIATGVLAVIAAVVILATTGPVKDAARSTQPPSSSTGRVLSEFLESTLDQLEGSGPLLVVTTGSVRGDYGDALRFQLERAGIDVVATPSTEILLGPERSEARRTPTAVLWIVSAESIAEFRNDPKMKELGGWDPLSAEERRSFSLDKSHLQDQLIAIGRVDLAEAIGIGGGGVDTEASRLAGIDKDLLSRVEAIRRKGDPVAIFLGPA